jgi:2-haloacid dehalogenase
MHTDAEPATLNSSKACVFDAYGTLFDVHSAVDAFSEQVGPQHHEVSQLWRKKQLEYTWLRSLMGEYVDFWQVTGEALDFALEHHRCYDNILHAELMQAYLTLSAFPEVTQTLQLLKKAGIATAILTNGSPDMIEAAVKSANLKHLIDHQLSVDKLGVYKPTPAVYQLAVEALGVSAQDITFLSSNAWDASGAANFGMQVVWVNRYGQPPERLPGRPVASVKDLSALPGICGIC